MGKLESEPNQTTDEGLIMAKNTKGKKKNIKEIPNIYIPVVWMDKKELKKLFQTDRQNEQGEIHYAAD